MMDLATAPAFAPESPTVKSAHRVLEVLEYFAQGSGKATVMQIANDLAYPQSSTSVLLASLAKLGYLRFESEDRTYAPTLRVMLLGSWMQDQLFGQGSLVSEMERLRDRTGQTVMIGLRQGVHVRFILNLPGKDPQALRFPLGVLRPVCRSAAGRILLARLPDEEILRIARSANAQVQEPSDFISPSDLMTEIEGIRERGWNLATNYPLPNRATLAMPLPALLGQPPMSLIVGARKATMLAKFDDILDEMRQSCARLMSGPVQQVELPDSRTTERDNFSPQHNDPSRM